MIGNYHLNVRLRSRFMMIYNRRQVDEWKNHSKSIKLNKAYLMGMCKITIIKTELLITVN